MSIDYHPHAIPLRVNGWLFDKVWLVVHSFDSAMKYGIAVEDPTFGRFELTSGMLMEWKVDGRWYQTRPALLIEHLLSTTPEVVRVIRKRPEITGD